MKQTHCESGHCGAGHYESKHCESERYQSGLEMLRQIDGNVGFPKVLKFLPKYREKICSAHPRYCFTAPYFKGIIAVR